MPTKKTDSLQKAFSHIPDINLTADAVKKYFCPDATPTEIALFLNECKIQRLDPRMKEVYLIKYSKYEPASTVIAYNVFLKRADETKKLKGWKVITDGGVEDPKNFKAVITIFKDGWDEPFVHEVFYEEAVQIKKADNKPNRAWTKMPKFLLKKCAIGQGFRLAFPGELGGLPYLQEELPIETEYIEAEIVEEKKEKPEKKEQPHVDKIKVKKSTPNEPPNPLKPKEPEKTDEPEQEVNEKASDVVNDIQEKIKEFKFDEDEFREFLYDFQTNLKEQKRLFVAKVDDKYCFSLENVEDLKLVRLHFSPFMAKQFKSWKDKKEEESREEDTREVPTE